MPPKTKKIPVLVVILSPHNPRGKKISNNNPQKTRLNLVYAQLERTFATRQRSGPQSSTISVGRAEPNNRRNPFRATFSRISRFFFGARKPLSRIFREKKPFFCVLCYLRSQETTELLVSHPKSGHFPEKKGSTVHSLTCARSTKPFENGKSAVPESG